MVPPAVGLLISVKRNLHMRLGELNALVVTKYKSLRFDGSQAASSGRKKLVTPKLLLLVFIEAPEESLTLPKSTNVKAVFAAGKLPEVSVVKPVTATP